MIDTRTREPRTIPDLLRIMDVASALRRERERAETELAIDETKDRLRKRLSAAAAESGDPVTAEEIDTAIDSYFDSQFEFVPPKRGIKVLVAHAWVRRVLLSIVGSIVLLLGGGTWFAFFSASAPLSASARAERALNSVWVPLQGTLARLGKLAADGEAKDAVEAIVSASEVARSERDVAGLGVALTRANDLEVELGRDYVLRVVSRPGESSGKDAYYVDEQGQRISGYYLIVEAFDGKKILPMTIHDAETQRSVVAAKWGEQVPKAVYDRVKADKQADGIVDDVMFARKERGHLHETVVMMGGDGKTPLPRGRRITNDL